MNSGRRKRSGYEESAFSEFLRSPMRYLQTQWRRLAGENETMRAERSFVEQVGSFLTLPFRFFGAFVVFMVQAWTTSRNGFAFIRGFPAVLTAFAVFGAFWLTTSRYDINVNRTRARVDISYAQYQENPEYSEMYAEKLVEFRPDDAESKYILATARERVGDMRSARELMHQLATTENSETAKANVWLGKYYLLNQDKDVSKEESQKKALTYFNLVLDSEEKEDTEELVALMGLADISQAKGDLEDAESYLSQALNRNLVSLMQLKSIPRLIKLQQDLGQNEKAQRQLDNFIRRIRPLARQNPEMFEVWYVLVKCATLMKDYDRGREIIEDAVYQTVKDSKVRENLIRLMAEVSVIEASDYETIDDLDNYRGKLFALCEAIRTDPRSRDAYAGLIDFAAPKSMIEEKRLWLRDCVIGCPNPAVIHVILGMQEIQAGDFVQGQKHWRIADQQFDLSQYIVNNMIELAVEKSDQFENLMDMLTVALELFPDQAALYQTRGMYNKKEKQYPEAIKDLEFAVEKLPKLVPARQLLLECYQAVNDTEKAAATQEEIDDLIRDLNEQERVAVNAFLRRNAAKKAAEDEESK